MNETTKERNAIMSLLGGGDDDDGEVSNLQYSAALRAQRAGNAYGGSGGSGSSSIGLIVGFVVLGVFMTIGIILLFTWYGNRTISGSGLDPSQQCVCPAGPDGPSGPSGPEGPDGRQGERGLTGDKGDTGDQGVPGGPGPAGQCDNNNPECQKGDTGPEGPAGETGERGPQGLTGNTGDTGADGPSGPTGPTGPDGPEGPEGPIGPQGVPGVCDCLLLGTATFDTLNVTTSLYIPTSGTFTLNGTMTCPGGALDISCFGLSVCPDFSTCDLDANTLVVRNPTTAQGLYLSKTNLTMASPTPFSSTVTFGDSSILNDMMSLFRSYASSVIIDGDSTSVYRTLRGPFTIQTGVTATTNHINLISQTSQILGTAATGVLFSTTSGPVTLNTPTTTFSGASTGQAVVGGLNITISSSYTTIKDPSTSLQWMTTNPDNSYVCPLVGATLVSDGARDSVQMGSDVTFASGTRLLSLAADGVIETVGLKLYCTPSITTVAGVPLILQTNSSQYVDVRGIMTNLLPSGQVQFLDSDGVNFVSTPLHNTGGGGLHVDDTIGLIVDNGAGPSTSTLATNRIASLSAGLDTLTITAASVVIDGNVEIRGNLVDSGVGGGGGGTITAPSGACCTSDRRVKRDIERVDPAQDLARIRALPERVSFRYTDAYLETDRRARNVTIDGFIAQELQSAGFGDAMIYEQPTIKLRNGDVLDGFQTIRLDALVPHLVGAIQELDRQLQVAMKRIEELSSSRFPIIKRG